MKPQSENKVIAGKTILFNNVTRCTFVASDTDELIQTGSRENDSHIEWAGELSIAVIVPNKCHKCDADILQKGVDFCEKCEDKPQTTPIKSAEDNNGKYTYCLTCNGKLAALTGYAELTADQEPYAPGEIEEIDLYARVYCGVLYCENCETPHSIWSDDIESKVSLNNSDNVKEFLIKELEMSKIQADTLYEDYILACAKFASLQTTAKEKEFYERLEELEQKIEKFNSMIIDNSEYAKGYSGGLSDCAGLVSKLKSTYNHNQQNDGK